MASTSPSTVRAPALQPGDRVRVISPAGPVIDDLLRDGLQLLDDWGLDVVVDDDVYLRRQPYDYLAGSDNHRLRAFVDAWSDPDCRAIICSRGGYGTMRILEELPIEDLVAEPRLFVGFSDITALHLYLAGCGGLATVHGPVIKSLRNHDNDSESAARLHNALFADGDAPRPWTGMTTLRPGTARGPVFGGNLSLLVPMLSSPFRPSLDGAIVIVEDIGEADYRIDRLLTALRLADDADIGGLVIGDFTDCDGVFVDADEFDDFLAELTADFDCPVVAGAPVGHSDPNFAFPVGVLATLDADCGELRFHRHAAAPR